MIKTHYLKVEQCPGTSLYDKKLSYYDSIIYSLTSAEELKTLDLIRYSLLKECQLNHPDWNKILKDTSTIQVSLDRLVGDGFLKRLNGQSLSRAIAGV